MNKAAPGRRRARISLVPHKLDDSQCSPFGRSCATRFLFRFRRQSWSTG